MRGKAPLLIALCITGGAWEPLYAAHVTHCPQGSTPARTVNPDIPWACVLTDDRYQDGIDCPAGSRSC